MDRDPYDSVESPPRVLTAAGVRTRSSIINTGALARCNRGAPRAQPFQRLPSPSSRCPHDHEPRGTIEPPPPVRVVGEFRGEGRFPPPSPCGKLRQVEPNCADKHPAPSRMSPSSSQKPCGHTPRAAFAPPPPFRVFCVFSAEKTVPPPSPVPRHYATPPGPLRPFKAS